MHFHSSLSYPGAYLNFDKNVVVIGDIRTDGYEDVEVTACVVHSDVTSGTIRARVCSLIQGRQDYADDSDKDKSNACSSLQHCAPVLKTIIQLANAKIIY